MNNIHSLGKAWITLLDRVMMEGKHTEDYTEIFNTQIYFNEASDTDSILIDNGLSENIVEMRKVFFTEEENKFGHNYSKAFVGPYGNHGVADIVSLLKENTNSKRAVLTFIPYKKGKVPCINFIHFLIRDNKLKVHYFSRGQDIYNKFACDAICIMDMAKEVSKELNIDIEGITANISSAHIYDEDVSSIKELKRI